MSKAVVTRSLLAAVGGYVISAVLAIATARALPLPRADAVLFGTMASFLVYASVVVWVFRRWRNGFRVSMSWLHTWTGLLLGWVLYAVFVTGTLSYVRHDLSAWMRPEARMTNLPAEPVAHALNVLTARAPTADRWTIGVPDAHDPGYSIQWRGKAGDGGGSWDDRSGDFVPVRATAGGDFLYRFHYDLGIPRYGGEWLVGVATMLMLVGLISGVVTHRRFFRDFFTLRAYKGGARAWLDLHNMSSVLALPFHLMITFTGLLTLMFVYLPWAQSDRYPEGEGAFSAEAYGNAPAPKASGVAATSPVSLAALDEIARRWKSIDAVGRVFVYHPADAAGVLEVRPDFAARVSLNHGKLLLNASDGTPIREVANEGAGVATRAALVGLHVGRFADPLLRALFIACGIAGAVMSATGLVLWSRKRQDDSPHPGRRIVDALNLTAIVGVLLATGAYFAANRLLPSEWPERAAAEQRVFFLALGVSFLLAFVKRDARGWQLQLGATAVTFAALPVLTALTTDRSLAAGDLSYAALEAASLVVAAALSVTAVWIGRRPHRVAA